VETKADDIQLGFDYASLAAEARAIVQARTTELHVLVRRSAQDIIVIGQKLNDVKQRLDHGQFGVWLDAEFGWTDRTARNFMQVADKFKSENFSDLRIAPSALYLLAAPSTPDDVREEALRRAGQGENITHQTAKQLIDAGKPVPAATPEAHAKDALAAAADRRGARLAAALADAPAPVIQVVRNFGVDEPDVVEDLKRIVKSDGKPGSSDTCSEILQTGWIQPGDEEEAVHITEGAEKVRAALRLKSDIHAQLGRDAKDAVWLSSESNEWYTPAKYIEAARRVLGGFDVDPASNDRANQTVRATVYYTKENSGLDKDWPGRVWLNPPYGGLSGAFVARLVEQVKAGITTEAIVLVNANSTETKWFAPMWDYTLCFTDHRIDFETPTGARNGSTHGSVFVYIGKNVETFAREFDPFGYIVARLRVQAALIPVEEKVAA